MDQKSCNFANVTQFYPFVCRRIVNKSPVSPRLSDILKDTGERQRILHTVGANEKTVYLY